MPNVSSYVICTAPRSGSTLLCMLLATTGVAGDPQSWFHANAVDGWAAALGLERESSQTDRARLAEVFAAAQTAGRAGRDVFGLRLQAHSLTFFLRQLETLYPGDETDSARIASAFGPTRFIHLRRASKLDQAVSYLKATQSGLWHAAPDGREIERLSPPAEPVYNADEIRGTIAQMDSWDHLWDDWFAREAITPLRINYDSLAQDPRATVRDLLTDLGCDPSPVAGLVVPTRKLADTTSGEWTRRFRAERDGA